MRIFFSHSTRDRDLASALKSLLQDTFGIERLAVDFSSDQEAGGGIPPGEQWLPWIRERIERADRTYVLLTPNSIAKPWVLWEAGAAAGVALALNKPATVVPITFGIPDSDIPSPLTAAQRIRGDSTGTDGIKRLLQAVNTDLGRPYSQKTFASAVGPGVRSFTGKARAALAQSAPLASLLASVPSAFPASTLAGSWVTCYQIAAGGDARCHADIALITPESERRVRIRNYPPEPRTDGHVSGFRNEIEGEIAGRHLVGFWKNLSDTSYFGAVQLAVLPGDDVMDGRFTSLDGNDRVGGGRWRWVRLEPSVPEERIKRVTLFEPRLIYSLVQKYPRRAGPLRLADVAEEA